MTWLDTATEIRNNLELETVWRYTSADMSNKTKIPQYQSDAGLLTVICVRQGAIFEAVWHNNGVCIHRTTAASLIAQRIKRIQDDRESV